MRHYIGIIHKDADSDFGISFPDFPGCVSAGRTLEETTAMGQEALEGHIAVMRDAEEPVPEASTLDALAARLAEEGGTPVFIPAPHSTLKTVRIDITLPEDALRQIDSFAEDHGLTRSGFLVSAAKRAMADA